MKSVKQVILDALSRHRGDDFERAQSAFHNMSPEQMRQQFGFSGKTRQQILDDYKEHVVEVENAINYVNTHL